VPNLERARLARVRRLIRDWPATTTLVAVTVAIIVTAIAVPDSVAVWVYLFLLGVVMGFAIVGMVQLERISRRSARRSR
jgi:hypothetical protein